MSDAPVALLLDDLLLRPWRPDDLDALHTAGQDPELTRWIHLPEPFGPDEAAAMLEGFLELWRDGTGASFAIVDPADTQLLGAVTRYGPDGHAATLGMWLAPAGRGRGLGTRALRLVIDWTFATTDAIRVDGFIEAGNEASLRMTDRVGFRREGTLRAWELGPGGRPMDCVAVSVVRSDDRWDPLWPPTT